MARMISLLRPQKRRKRSGRRRRRARRNPRFGYHRPTLLFSRGGWKRPRRSRLFTRSTRVNPRRRRRSFRFRRYRRNPALPFRMDKVAMGGLKVAGGIALGFLAMPVMVNVMPAGILRFRNLFGLGYIVIGSAAAAFIRQKDLKDVALVFAGVGVYDLIASNLRFLGLSPIGGAAALPAAGSEQPGVIGASYQPGMDYQPSLGASYQPGGDDISYGGDEVVIE